MASVALIDGPGAQARARGVRGSAYKVREVLNQIRGKSCDHAREVLAFSERDAAHPVSKVLESAIANAEHNEGLDSDELYVAACFADEGPTLRRFRSRARGRATRIRKRSCHITVIVRRFDPTTLQRLRSGGSRGAVGSAEARRRRVARSRAVAAGAGGDVGTRAADALRAAEGAMAGDSGNRSDETEARN